VIDSNINGRSVGGVRIMEDTSLEELKNLARGMTLKSGFLGLPLGGSKGAVIADGENLSREEKIKLLKRFVEIVKPLVYEKRYRLGPDMNTSASNSE
jgi:glutamate dehydrogenase/leucine dehydrogenase